MTSELALRPIPQENKLFIAMKALIRWKDKLLVVRDRPDPKADHWTTLWDVPGGRMKFGERPLEVLEREVFEEVGLEKDDYKINNPLLVWTHVNAAGNQIVLVGFDCELKEGAESKIRVGPELSEWRWADQDTCRRLALTGSFKQVIAEDYWRIMRERGLLL